jgi:hypothetical protein
MLRPPLLGSGSPFHLGSRVTLSSLSCGTQFTCPREAQPFEDFLSKIPGSIILLPQHQSKPTEQPRVGGHSR